jgi:hypothetical protein
VLRHHQRPVAQPNADLRIVLDGCSKCSSRNDRVIQIRVASSVVGHVDGDDFRPSPGCDRGAAAMKEMILEAFNIEPSKKISRETQF